jgi:Ca2+ transporting ATPase
MFYEGGPQISFYELTHFHKCSALFSHLDCGIFSASSSAARHGATMSLSILVVIEMFNACNSLSENESLLSLPLWANPYLIVAIAVSMVLHFAILYVPFLATLFGVTPLSWAEWKAVIVISAPVVLIDEVLKFVTRTCIEPPSEDPEPAEKANGHKH